MGLRVTYEELENRGFDAGGGVILYYNGEPFTGTVIENNENGVLCIEEEFTDGHLGGAQRVYHENGQMAEEYFIAYNAKYGLSRSWDEQGNLIDEYDFGRNPYMTIVAIDVYYFGDSGKAVGALFQWDDNTARHLISLQVDNVEPYVPGEFYKRELPCILELIKLIGVWQIEIIIVDGNVYIDNQGTYGLGGKLWEALDGKIPVIGVAKTSFKNTEEKVIPVLRGQSQNPLYVSAIGMEVTEAAELIKGMKGEYRMPDILKQVDTATKEV